MTTSSKSIDFNLSIENQIAVVTRNATFPSGDTISFTVRLQKPSESTLKEIHYLSIQTAIDQLQSFLEQK